MADLFHNLIAVKGIDLNTVFQETKKLAGYYGLDGKDISIGATSILALTYISSVPEMAKELSTVFPGRTVEFHAQDISGYNHDVIHMEFIDGAVTKHEISTYDFEKDEWGKIDLTDKKETEPEGQDR